MQTLLMSVLLATGGTQAATFPPGATLALLTHEARNGTDEIVCVRVDGHDPSGALLKKVRHAYPRAVPASTCTRPAVGVTYKPTGADAVLFSISRFHATSKTRAQADFEVNVGPLGGNWYTVRFRRIHGRWVVQRLDEYMAS